jgi:ketosteroid isomerase-like protein
MRVATERYGSEVWVSNRDIFMAIIDRGFSKGDLSVADEICAHDLVEHQYPIKAHLTGAEILKDQIASARTTVNNLTLVPEQVVEVDDAVWALLRGSGTEARSGKPVSFYVMDICRFKDARLIEHWGVPDRFAILHQTGALPVTRPPGS